MDDGFQVQLNFPFAVSYEKEKQVAHQNVNNIVKWIISKCSVSFVDLSVIRIDACDFFRFLQFRPHFKNILGTPRLPTVLKFSQNEILLQHFTFRPFGERSGQALDADLQLDVPDTQHLVLGEADELAAPVVKLDLHDGGHVTTQHAVRFGHHVRIPQQDVVVHSSRGCNKKKNEKSRRRLWNA